MTVAWPLLTRAQQLVKKIGFLRVSSPSAHAPFVVAFNEGLREGGFIEGQNLALEYSWAEGKFDRLPKMAADLIRNKVDVIVAMSGDISIRAATTASSTVPVVFITGSDPVQTGLVASLARPGGNVTGFSMVSNELMASANATAKALNDRGLPSGRGGKWTARSVINVRARLAQ